MGLATSACNSDDGSSSAKESPAASESAPAPESSEPTSAAPSADGADGAEASGDTTAPGTKLKIGDRAVLPYRYTADKKGTVAVTVTAIDKGAESDMASFGAKAKGMTPYYIRMKVENVGGTDLSYASLKLDGVLEGGGPTGVILIGGLPGKCKSESAPSDFKTKGASYETCALSASKTGPVTGASYDEGDAYSDSPVVWSAG
ncbi:hypothetical protein GTW43_08540 [Streptomyces sp. SID5785]|uniref:hypothetical protein n=1 Tax=Streptomyces sp. SID5785 TaxID=2690309 RepID=UPI00136197E7|nr:hypothetical protein [Streptomyces sp. SID5785]MZD05132.1 hypothetical protein [Streptomyces sp. SID5785]